MRSLSAEEIELLKDLASGAIESLEPSACNGEKSVRYLDAEPYFRGFAADSTEAIESMARRGFLVPASSRTVRRCPNCDIELDGSSTACPSCASPDIVKRDVLEHPACGCTKPRAEFESDDEDPRLALYAPLCIVGYRQFCDLVAIRSVIDVVTGREVSWTRPRRLAELERPDEEP